MSAPCPIPDCPASSHDTYSSYRRGCRNDVARDAYRRYEKQLGTPFAQVRRLPTIGSRRRLQALAAIGHTWVDLADELGISWERVSRIARGAESAEYMTRPVVDAIAELYKRHSMTPGRSKRTRSRALNRGWAPPLAWDNPDDPLERPDFGGKDRAADENVVEAVVAERLTWDQLTYSDQDHLVTVLLARDWTTAEIAARAGTDPVAVRRVTDRMRNRQKRSAA